MRTELDVLYWKCSSPGVMISQVFSVLLYMIPYICHMYILKCLKYCIRKIVIKKNEERSGCSVLLWARPPMAYFKGKTET